MHPPRPQRLVEPTAFQFAGFGRQLDRQIVVHHRQRLPVGGAQSLNRNDLVPGAQVQFGGHLVVGLADAVFEELRGRLLSRASQIVEEAGEFDPTMNGVLHDLGTDAALVDHFLDGPPGGRPRQRESLGQVEFVLESIAGREVPIADGRLDGLGQLVIQRHRTRPIELNVQRHVAASDLRVTRRFESQG